MGRNLGIDCQRRILDFGAVGYEFFPQARPQLLLRLLDHPIVRRIIGRAAQRQPKELRKSFIHRPIIQIAPLSRLKNRGRPNRKNFSLKYPATSSPTGHSPDEGGILYRDPKSCVRRNSVSQILPGFFRTEIEVRFGSNIRINVF